MKWGRRPGGPEPGRGELNQPHSLAMDSRGRLIVGTRSCNCVQIWDHTGTSSGEGVAVDAKGNVWSAEVGQMSVKKYVKK